VYLCAFAQADGTQSWLALDDRGSSLTNRTLIRDAASIAALVEIADASAAVPVGDEPRSHRLRISTLSAPLRTASSPARYRVRCRQSTS
jgi:hypothetical protein